MTRLLLVLSMTAAVTVAGLLMWKAEATPLTGALSTHAVTGGYSAVQKAAGFVWRIRLSADDVQPPIAAATAITKKHTIAFIE